MIFVILSWIYISLLIFSPGFVFSEMIRKIAGSGKNYGMPVSLILINGLVVAAITALFFGLLYKVGLLAHLFLLVLSIACYLIYRKSIGKIFHEYRVALKKQAWFVWVLFIIFLLIQSYASYMPSSHGDDGLYYSTSIKWVQEYGTIPGLANLNTRIGFNSSWLILQAIFGFPYLHAGLFNDLNGLLFMYVFLIFLDGLKKCWSGDRSLFAFLLVLFFIPVLFLNNTADMEYVFFNQNLFGSPSPDIPACLLTWLVLILFVQPENETTGGRRQNQVLIVVYGAWLLTIKLSAIVIVLPMCYVIISWIRSGSWKVLMTAAVSVILMIIPWCVRNIILTGYLLYPLPAADFFSFDWKMPMDHVKAHHDEIRIYAINSSVDLSKPFDQSVLQWFPGWFDRLSYIQSVLVFFMGAGIAGFFSVLLYRIRQKGIEYFYNNHRWVFAVISCITGIIFWLFNGPDVRFGLGFGLFFVMFAVAWVCHFFLREYVRPATRIFYGILVLFSLYYYGSFLNGIVNHFARLPLTPRLSAHIIGERDMGHAVKIQLVDFMDSWNTALPCAPAIEMGDLNPVLRGSGLKQGFRATQ